MRYYRCKCGKRTAFGSTPPYRCSKCDDCGSNLAEGPKWHADPLPHKYVEDIVETDAGDAVLTRCSFCHRTKKEIEK